VPRAELRKAILYLPPESTCQTVPLGGHKVDIHPLHGEVERPKNIETCAVLLKHDPKAKLKLLPVIEEKDLAIKDKFYPKNYVEKFRLKNADAIYNGKVVEFEEPTGSGSSIKRSIRNGKEQADFVIMRVPDSVDLGQIEHYIFGQLGHYKGQNIDVWVVNSSELRKYKPL
jgi:hypothetical protein